MTSTTERDATYLGLKLWLGLYFMQPRQKGTKTLPTLNFLDPTVSCVGHAFQTLHVLGIRHVITSNNCAQLLTNTDKITSEELLHPLLMFSLFVHPD